MPNFKGKTIVVIGASGGLGAAIARAFSANGATLALAARRSGLPPAFPEQSRWYQADSTDPASLAALRDEISASHGKLDVVINATGYDARKSLAEHSLDDFQRTLGVNLLGAMLITQTFVPAMAEKGVILHLGGFADGRLAFPFYSADSASRAGLRAFAEAANRELFLQKSAVVVSFFSPSPAETEAERPFHPLWRSLGTEIVPVERVAAEVLETVAKRRKVHIMGGWLTRFFAAINAVAPEIADSLVMKSYSEKMAHFFGNPAAGGVEAGQESAKGPLNPVGRNIGILLVTLSFVAYGLLALVPFLPLETSHKLLLSPALVGIGEAVFWIGGLLLGKEVIARFKQVLNPCNWFNKKAPHA